MKHNFNANDTMRLLANQPGVTGTSKEGKAVKELLEGMGLPLTNDNIMLACYSLSIGKVYGVRMERARRNNGK